LICHKLKVLRIYVLIDSSFLGHFHHFYLLTYHRCRTARCSRCRRRLTAFEFLCRRRPTMSLRCRTWLGRPVTTGLQCLAVSDSDPPQSTTHSVAPSYEASPINRPDSRSSRRGSALSRDPPTRWNPLSISLFGFLYLSARTRGVVVHFYLPARSHCPSLSPYFSLLPPSSAFRHH